MDANAAMKTARALAGRKDMEMISKVTSALEEVVVGRQSNRQQPLFSVKMETHRDVVHGEVRFYAAVNGESSAHESLGYEDILQWDRHKAITKVRETLDRLEGKVDAHKDQIIERAFSQASTSHFFRG